MSHTSIQTPELSVIAGKIMAKSTEIAERFGKRHADVIRSIENLDIPEEFNQRNFASISYRDDRGRFQKAYNMTRDGFTVLVMGWTGKKAMRFKLQYIEAFNQMERRLQGDAGQEQLPAAAALQQVLQLVTKMTKRYDFPKSAVDTAFMRPNVDVKELDKVTACMQMIKLFAQMTEDGHDVSGPQQELLHMLGFVTKSVHLHKMMQDISAFAKQDSLIRDPASTGLARLREEYRKSQQIQPPANLGVTGIPLQTLRN